MSESKRFLSVGLDEVVDSDAFRRELLESTTCAQLAECNESETSATEQS